tara:strand:- start:4300 stop:4446 length:147 start_codon:yes stop_codon:yes gene_type:complete
MHQQRPFHSPLCGLVFSQLIGFVQSDPVDHLPTELGDHLEQVVDHPGL